MEDKFEILKNAMADLDETGVREISREIVNENPGNVGKIVDSLNGGMILIGERFDEYEYFVGDLIYAGEIFSETLEELKPLLTKEREKNGANKKPYGKVILCTVEGDLHDIGKNIVKYVMESHNLEVIDLGVNVPASEVVNRTILEGASVVALSAVLTIAVDSMEKTISAFADAGIRNDVKIIVGGSCTSPDVARRIGADEYGATPEDTAIKCLRWITGKKAA